MKNLSLIIIALVATSVSAFAAGGVGGIKFPINSLFNGTKPADYTCAIYRTSTTPSNLVGAMGFGSRGTCVSPNPCTNSNSFGGGGYEMFVFKNTALTSSCMNIRTTVGVPFCQILTFSVNGVYVPNSTCAQNTGFNDTGGFFAWFEDDFEKEVPACSDFSVITWNFGARCSYQLTVTNLTSPGLINCTGAECKKLITIGGTPVPTMTQWGLFLFGLILLTFASVAVYNVAQREAKKV